ncbi:hypothetical protein MnTg02_00144 [bacterium MnTg02]|nr:hypothetical protein MnTg02_00144 [bacterium MnTg02]
MVSNSSAVLAVLKIINGAIARDETRRDLANPRFTRPVRTALFDQIFRQKIRKGIPGLLVCAFPISR